MKLEEAAARIGVSADNLRKSIDRGAMIAEKRGRSWWVIEEEVARYAVENRRFGARYTLAERFARHAPSSGAGCWEWTGHRTSQGYGTTSVYVGQYHHRMERAHRVAWMLAFGDIPDGMWVLHRCDNPPCVRPDHLFLGSRLDNIADMVAKDRHHKRPIAEMRAMRSRVASPFGIGHWSARLTEEAVRIIRSDPAPAHVLAERFHVSVGAVWAVRQRKTWKHVA